jgi:Ser/Thr protein kinase RdoA (MazF antagonist)
MIELGPLKREELEALARLIRDQHVRAYEWPAADEVIDSRLGSLTRALNGDKTREWVRGVVAALDSTLAEQSGK